MHVIDEGEGRPVLMLHGFPDSHRLWRHQIPALVEAGHRVIAPDLPGYGESDAPLELEAYKLKNVVIGLVGLLDERGIDRTAVVGHDWGAGLAWGMAAFLPDRIERLVALSVGHPAAPRTIEQVRDFWYMLLFQYPEAEELLTEDDWRLFRGALGESVDLERYVEDMSRPGRLTAALNWYRANLVPRSFLHGARGVPDVQCPTLGIWGQHDPACGEKQMVDSANHVTGTWRYERVEGAGHWIPLDAPERVTKLLLGFL